MLLPQLFPASGELSLTYSSSELLSLHWLSLLARTQRCEVLCVSLQLSPSQKLSVSAPTFPPYSDNPCRSTLVTPAPRVGALLDSETLTHIIILTSPIHYFFHLHSPFSALQTFPVAETLPGVYLHELSWAVPRGVQWKDTLPCHWKWLSYLTEGYRGPYLHTSKSLLPSDSLVSPPAWCENLILNSFKPFDLHKRQVTEHPILAVLRNAINPEPLPHRASGSLISQDLWAHIFFEGTQPTLKSQISLHMPAIYINKGGIKSTIYSFFFSYQSNFFSHLHLCRRGNFQPVPFFRQCCTCQYHRYYTANIMGEEFNLNTDSA